MDLENVYDRSCVSTILGCLDVRVDQDMDERSVAVGFRSDRGVKGGGGMTSRISFDDGQADR